jgi:hypothetical protein
MSRQPARVGYGNVVNIRSIPTRSVTRIEIELPIESHVEATRLLFGQDVLVMPVKLGPAQAYGMVSEGAHPDGNRGPADDDPAGEADEDDATQDQGTSATTPFAQLARATSAASATTVTRSPRPMGLLRSGDQPHTQPAQVDILRWLGARCREDAFQTWLGVRTEAAAIQAVRERCGVESRTQIPASPQRRQVFFRDIYHPYLASQRQARLAASPST